MICKLCQNRHHDDCRGGTWCDCGHVIIETGPAADECPRCHRKLTDKGALSVDTLKGIRCSGCSYRVGEVIPDGATWDKHSGIVVRDLKLPETA